MQKMVDKVIGVLIKCEVIKPDEKAIYAFGFRQSIIMAINLVSTLLIGFVFKSVLYSLIYTLALMLLRSYAGGFHAADAVRCYLWSVASMCTAIVIGNYLPWSVFGCLIAAGIASIIIFVMAPMEASNKPLDELETVVYRKRARLILIAEDVLIILFIMTGQMLIAIGITMAVLTTGFMLLLCKLHNSVSAYTGAAEESGQHK